MARRGLPRRVFLWHLTQNPGVLNLEFKSANSHFLLQRPVHLNIATAEGAGMQA